MSAHPISPTSGPTDDDRVPSTDPTIALPRTSTTARPTTARPTTAGEAVDDQPPAADTGRHRRARWVWFGVAITWLLGLVAGFIAVLTVAARAGCAGTAGGFGCGNGGSIVGVALTVIVVAVVGTVTVLALDARESWRVWLRHVLLGVLVMALVVAAARVVMSTL